MPKEPKTTPVIVREFPTDLLAEVDERARKNAGATGRPSRPLTIVDLVRRGLHTGTLRGDVNGAVPGTKREA